MTLEHYKDHGRNFDKFQYVYPVISRRSGGLSIGININKNKFCNYDCLYCQVDRKDVGTGMDTLRESENPQKFSEILRLELCTIDDLALSGELFVVEKFKTVPDKLRQIRDISLSGDGEPTVSPLFTVATEIVQEEIIRLRKQGVAALPVVITNGTTLWNPDVTLRLREFELLGGGPWIKLDAGTEEEFRRVNVSRFNFDKLVNGIIAYALETSVIIQSMLLKYADGSFSFQAVNMINRLKEMKQSGAKIKKILLYTLARKSKDETLLPCNQEELSITGKKIENQTGIQVEIFP